MDVKGKVLFQIFNKIKLSKETKTFLEPKFFSIVKFKKLGFSAPLTFYVDCSSGNTVDYWIFLITLYFYEINMR